MSYRTHFRRLSLAPSSLYRHSPHHRPVRRRRHYVASVFSTVTSCARWAHPRPTPSSASLTAELSHGFQKFTISTKVAMATDNDDDSVPMCDVVDECFLLSSRGHTSTPLPHGITPSAFILFLATKLIPSPNESHPLAFAHDGFDFVQS